MRARLGCLILTAFATRAYAAPPELALGEGYLTLEPRRDVLGSNDASDPFAAASSYAQLVAGSRGVGLGAGVAAAVSGANCDLVNASARGVLETGSTVAGDARWNLCLLNAAFIIRLSGSRGAGLAPAIDARHSLWRRRYDESEDRVEMGLGELWDPEGSPNRHSIFVVSMGRGTTSQSDGTTGAHVTELDLDFSMYRFRRGSMLQIDALALESDAVKAGATDLGATTFVVLPLKVRVDLGSWFASADAGVGQTGEKTTQSTSTSVDGTVVSSSTDTVDGSGLPALETFVGHATAGMRTANVTASATLARSIFPTIDGNQALESRASGTVEVALGKRRATRLAISPFVAHTRTWIRDAGSTRDVSAGASLQVDHRLAHDLSIGAVGEAGRTPYARLDGGARPSDVWGGQLLVALTAHRAAALR